MSFSPAIQLHFSYIQPNPKEVTDTAVIGDDESRHQKIRRPRESEVRSEAVMKNPKIVKPE
jgi:hypothetical protein